MNCNKLDSITSLNTTPPQAMTGDSDSQMTNKMLIVPGVSLSAYQNAPFWKEFGNIIGIGSSDEPNGTEDNPYLIATAEDLCNAHNLMVAGKTVYFKQTADIDMSEVTDYTELSNYDEISGLGAKSIYYDGGNHVIKNFTSTKSNPNSIFGYFSGTIKNLGIVNANVEEPSWLGLSDYIGILAKMSYAPEGTNVIDNVFITGDLAILDDSKYWVGPMCGYADGPLSITNSYVQVEFFIDQNNISGGLLGYANDKLNIENTYVATNSLCLQALVAHATESNLTANNVVAFGSGNAFGFNSEYENSTATVVPMNDRGGIDIVQSWAAFNQKKFYNGLPALNWQDGDYIDHFTKIDNPVISYNGRFITLSAENSPIIFYSLNNSSYKPYTNSFDAEGLSTIKAYSRKSGYFDSDIVEYQVHSYGTEMYAELDSVGSLSDAYQWADAATRNEINSNTNLLIYVPDIETANTLTGNHTNIVINDHADRITLNNAFPWYCPYGFEAANVTYTHSFSKQTAIDGGCAGWETIALPFDVQNVTHEKGDLYTFAANSDDYAHHFWLYEPSSYEWQPATAIEANGPYLIAMPNNPVYYDPFNITGEVTFSAQGATIPATPAELSHDFRDGYKLNVNYLTLAADTKRLVVNDEAVDGNEPGSCFVADQRAVRPFEAYLTAPGQNRVPIFNTTSLAEGLMTEMALRVWCDTPQSVSIAAPFDAKVNIYDISGRAVRTVQVPSGETVRLTDLPSGFYIIANTKIAIHR